MLEAQWKALVLPAPSRRLLRHTLLPLALALEVGSPLGLARAALGVEDTELYTGAERASVELLEAALVALDPGETVLRCRVLSQLGRALLDRGEVERANELSRAATDMARHLGDRRALLDVLLCERAARTGYPYSASQFLDIRRALDEMLAAAEEIGDPNLVERALGRVVPVVLEMGDRAAFEAQLARHGDSLQQHELNTHLYFNVSGRAMRAILSGEFAEAERLAGQALEAAREFRNEYADGVLWRADVYDPPRAGAPRRSGPDIAAFHRREPARRGVAARHGTSHLLLPVIPRNGTNGMEREQSSP